MSNTYISFEFVKTDFNKKPENISKRFIKTDVDVTAPVSNPDFINKFSDVVRWFIEFEDDSYFPNREIGFNILGEPIIILPWKANYGYWTDSNVILKDLNFHFKVTQISKSEFTDKWNDFERIFGKG